MLIKTHVSFWFLFVLIFLHYFDNVFFVFVSFFAVFIPDVDTKFSSLGKRKFFRPLQFFISHRGIFHSFFFLCFLCSVLYFFASSLIIPFFIGYSTHLFLDSFTLKGVRLFYPISYRFSWKIRTGGWFENFLFFVLLFIDLFVCLFILF